ncbi:inositol-pentakisphosphate 2-kinase [Sporobolomyces koalae]|uniref:inositol-pentakisphosphate 2-kinase n=1 Tax=Sporobolomyces koalae TaxID=500713 RepID=UPI00316EE895
MSITSELPPLASTSPRDWRYVAEGGANLVLSYIPLEQAYSNKVLRLRKRSKRTGLSVGGEPDARFSRDVVQPLLGSDHVTNLTRIRTESSWLVEMNRVLDDTSARPRFRVEQDEIDHDSPYAIVAQDLIGGHNVVAFEIKPKWGFLPRAAQLSTLSRSIKTTYCRFCMHRYHRNHSIDEHDTGYCPLDLYSRDERRMRTAVEALVSGWISSNGSLNNLRVFVNGEQQTPDNNVDLVSKLAQLTPNVSEKESLGAMIANLVVPTLLASPVLSTLSNLQSSLDPLDIEGLARLYPQLFLPEARPPIQPTTEEWTLFLDENVYYTFTQKFKRFDYLRETILAYLLSNTFKDCSIIVRFDNSPDNRRQGLEEPVGMVKVIDLDPKPITKLSHWYQLDQEIVKDWNRAMEETRIREPQREIRKCFVSRS